MLEHSRANALGKWRRWAFRVWIGITILLAGYIVAILPFVGGEPTGAFLAGAPVPIIMIILLTLGLGWLIWLVTSRRDRPTRDVGPEPASPRSGAAKPGSGTLSSTAQPGEEGGRIA
jgi:hypothetical protein